MRRWGNLVFVCAMALFLAGCDLPNLDPPGTAPMRYRDAVFSSWAVTTDVQFATATNLSDQVVPLDLDVYEPPDEDRLTNRPAIVWVHGGSFRSGDKSSPDIVDEATTFAKKGYVSFSINYRLEPAGCSAAAPTTTCLKTIQNATADAQTAVAWVRANASTYGVDPTRIAIAGTSAGGIIALQVGYATSETPTAPVQAAVALSGANLLSPISTRDAPALLLHGSSDTVVPYQWAVNTVDAAHSAGLTATFLTTWPGAGHVPYQTFREQILSQTTNFLWWVLDLGHAEQ
jgi:acetyl esterase/lipase